MKAKDRGIALCILAMSLLLLSCSLGQLSSSTTDSAITYGYADSIPVAIVSPEDVLQITMHDITYTTIDSIWVLGGYQITITFPSGEVTEIQLLNFEYSEDLSITGYSVLENGTSISGPSPSGFNADRIESGIGLYPSSYDVALFLTLPCSIASSNEEYTQEEFFGIWVDHISRHTVVCESGETYAFSFDNFSYMDEPSLKPSSVTLSVSVSN
jgi:hypothetical protein